MPEALQVFDEWLLRTTLGGGVVLLIGSLWMAFTRQPVQRQRIGEFALLAALLVALPAALPSWWALPSASTNSATNKALFGQSISSNSGSPAHDKSFTVAMNDEDDSDDLNSTLQSIISMYTMQTEERDDTDTASIVGPCDSGSDTSCIKGSMVSLWGKWALRLIGFSYLGLVIVLLIRCSIGYYGLWRFWRQRRPAPAHVHAALAELEPDLEHRPRIGVNSLVHGPVSYGLWKPTILLPPAFCNEGDPEKLRWILAHELTHLRRRDAWGCLLLALGGALYFHVPWFWWMKRHVRLAQEYLADAAAAQIATAVEYAQYLVSLTTLTSRPSLASSRAAGVFETPSDLYRRVHMLLHQRNVIERGAPRWWTLTAAASFLTLAACTAGVQLYADEPVKTEHIEVVVVTDDDHNTDKKKTEKKTITVHGKGHQSDGKTFVWTATDEQNKPEVIKLQGTLSSDKQKSLDEAVAKLERLLDKSSKQLDDNTRTQLEELKKTLKSLKETNKVLWLRQAELAKEGQATARMRLLGAEQAKEDMTKAQLHLELAQKQAATQRDQALAAEKLARAAQEKALTQWKDAKDGNAKDAAIKELEKAIAEKEKALRALKNREANMGGMARVLEAVPLVPGQGIASGASKGRLGVVTAEIDATLRSHLDLADGQGLMLNEVIDPSPAWNKGNGLRSSDILVEFAGKKVPANMEEFREIVNKLGEGTYTAVVFRKGKKVTINGIKLPAPDKNKKVVLEDVMIQPGAQRLVTIEPLVHLAGDHVILENRPGSGAGKTIDLRLKSLDNIKAEQIEQLAKTDLALEVVGGKIEDIDRVALKPLNKSIPLDLVVPLADRKTVRVAGHPIHISTLGGDQDQAAGKPRLGVTLEEVPEAVASQIELPEDRGLFVRDVLEGSAAQKAGILKNDILIEFADKPVTKDHPAFSKMLKEMKPGKYNATVVRKGKEIRIRNIELVDVKADSEMKKSTTREWVVEGDGGKLKLDEGAKPKVRDKKANDKEKDDFFPNARGQLRFAPAQGNMSVSINNDQFTAIKNIDGKTITVTGKMNNGKAEPSSITIKNDEGSKKYKAVNDVPEEDRADVEKMLTSFKGNVFQWNGAGRFNLNNGQFNNEAFNKQLEERMKQFEKSMKLLGDGNPGLEQMEKQLEQLRQQLEKMRGGKDENNK